MLAAQALAQLETRLSAVTIELARRCENPGVPQVVETAAKATEKVFSGYAKLQPNKRAIYECVLELLRGRKLSTWQQDLVAFGLTEPVREMGNATVLGSPRLEGLLLSYERQAQDKDLWPLSWHALLSTYFSFDPQSTRDESTKAGWKRLQAFLQKSWPNIDKAVGQQFVPDWVAVLRKEPQALTENPADKYAVAYLKGDRKPANHLARDLGIPETSWFWHSLVLSAVHRAAAQTDDVFRSLIPKLIGLLRERPAFRDEAIECLLVRYHACQGAQSNEELKNYVIAPDVWKNPKLKLIGHGGASWNRVPEPVWRMVLKWVNQGNLRDFFDILAARNQADAGRLAFWSRYMDQIAWARLIFGQETLELQRRNEDIRKLIADEQGMSARLTSPQKKMVDAFLMQLGNYLVVEFSKKPNACYVYKANELPFAPYASEYDGGSPDLAVGPSGKFAARIVHMPNWELGAEAELRKLGIRPDRGSARQPQTARATGYEANSLNLAAVRDLVARYPGAHIKDERASARGRLWVMDPQQRRLLGRELEQLGFSWSGVYSGWYHLGS